MAHTNFIYLSFRLGNTGLDPLERKICFVLTAQGLDSGDLGSVPSSAIDFLCDLSQIT